MRGRASSNLAVVFDKIETNMDISSDSESEGTKRRVTRKYKNSSSNIKHYSSRYHIKKYNIHKTK